MAEPVRKSIDSGLLDEEPGITLERWVERPGGRMELVSMPLTPELFLNPQVGDKMTQGKRHLDTARWIAERLEDFFRPELGVLVTMDMKHLFGPGLDQPSPDISVIRGVRNRDADRESFDAIAEGVRPCLIIEIVSPLSSRIRKTDLEDKVTLYRRVGIQEYLILDCRRRDRRFQLIGYRLSPSGYQPIKADDEGRLLSETTGLWFQVAPDGDPVLMFEYPSGRPIPTREEKAIAEAQARKMAEEKARAAEEKVIAESQARKAAEEMAVIEAQARRAAEKKAREAGDEISRLRAEIDRLRKS
jgi:Uma2 family endonuclease